MTTVDDILQLLRKLGYSDATVYEDPHAFTIRVSSGAPISKEHQDLIQSSVAAALTVQFIVNNHNLKPMPKSLQKWWAISSRYIK